ncbi:MAG: rhomboid family intramembrane serine protease [Planctomycetes bacterium]|nr:rhomboid family intramembrane serine protease [Planctomycetota bacterium]
MGIYSRDYLRDSPGPSGFAFRPGSVCKWIIIANIAVFLLQNVSPYVQYWLELDPAAVVRGQVWRLVTYSFCHAREQLLHIIFNMLFVWWFGRALETMFGSREFLLFYLTAALIAGLSFVGLQFMVHDLSPAIGASGAVMAIVMVYAMYYPRQQILIWGIIPVEIRWLVVFYLVFDGWPVLVSLTSGGGGDGIAHAAHLGGLAFGFLYKRQGWRLETWAARIRWPGAGRVFRPRPKLRVFHPEDDAPDDLDEQVDRILEKIYVHGEASLTEAERALLKKASRKYKHRSP